MDKKLLLSLAVALVLSVTPALAQDNFSSFSEYLSPEKLYLHTDRDVYCVGDTVWFKAYLKNASWFSHYAECNYIYVDIISSLVETDAILGRDVERESVRARVKVKRNADGCFSGYIPVPNSLNTGISVLRAYSYWMLNKEPVYMFNKNLDIRNPLKDDSYKSLVDSGERATEKYTELGMPNPYSVQRKDEMKTDVQFLPESGRYLAGLACTIGIKAVAQNGLGTKVQGKIYADDEIISEFSTNTLGLGKTKICVPEGTQRVHAVVTDAQGLSKKVRLPSPESAAAIITCSVDGDKLRAEISVRGLNEASELKVVAYDRNELYLELPYDPRKCIVELPYAELTAGINNIAIVDREGNVYAERAFFVCPSGMAQASVESAKEEYSSKQKVDCRFTLQLPEGSMAGGDFSVSVMDDGYAPYGGEGYNIVSYMYLGSELQGFVEDAWRYFDENRPLRDRMEDADLLMLTQGWKYYDLQSILKGEVPLPLCGKEYTQSISGKVIMPFGKRVRKTNISFLAPSIRYSSIHQLDTTGAFVLSGLNFPYGTRFLVSAESLGGNRMFTPVLDNDVFAREYSYPKYLTPSPYDYFYKLAALPEFYNEDGTPTYILNTSYVTANRAAEQKNLSPFPEYNFKPGQYRTPEQMQPYETYDIASYITSTFPSVRIDTTSNGELALLCRTDKISTRMTISTGWEPVIIFIDRMEGSYNELLQYTIGDLEGLAYVSGNDALKFNSYQTATSPRSVLMVKTRELKKTPPNVASISPLGWQRPAKMYAPVYDTEESKRVREFIRPSLYWNPELRVDENGKAEFSFYTSSHYAPCTVLVEGMTLDGQPVFCTAKIGRE